MELFSDTLIGGGGPSLLDDGAGKDKLIAGAQRFKHLRILKSAAKRIRLALGKNSPKCSRQ